MSANTEAKVYSSDQVLCRAANQDISTGRSEAEFLTIKPSGADYTVKRGADGQTTFSRTNNRGKTVTLKLMQTSLGNSILVQLRALGLASPNGATFLFEVIDLTNGATVLSGSHSLIMSAPEMPYGPEAGEREWTIEVASADNDDASGYPSQ